MADKPSKKKSEETVLEDQGQHAGPPRSMGKYHILSELGRGGMGTVYLARDPLLDRLVAVKTLTALTRDKGQSNQYIARFLREARAIAKLDHPHIVTIHEIGEEDGLYYIVMEYLDGRPLSRIAPKSGDIPLVERLNYMVQMCRGMQAIHEAGMVHRDVKPDNIMISKDGIVKIMDFGTVHTEDSDLTRVTQILGTPSYMSPEQIKGHAPDHRSDIFSLGAVFYYLLTGEKAFPGESFTTITYKIHHEKPSPPSKINTLLPSGLDGVVFKALAKSPEERYESCKEMGQAIEDFMAGKHQAGNHQEHFSLKSRIMTGLGLLLALMVLVFASPDLRHAALSLFKDTEPAPTATPKPATPEAGIAESTPGPTSEATETSPEATLEPTSEATESALADQTPEPDTEPTAEATAPPESTPSPTPEAAEATPEPTPEPGDIAEDDLEFHAEDSSLAAAHAVTPTITAAFVAAFSDWLPSWAADAAHAASSAATSTNATEAAGHEDNATDANGTSPDEAMDPADLAASSQTSGTTALAEIEAQPLSFDLNYLYQHKDTEQVAPLEDGAVLDQGDRFKILFTPDENCHVYIFLLADGLAPYLLFPLETPLDKDSAGRNPVKADTSYELPGRDMAFVADPGTGSRRILFFACRDADYELEEIYKSLRRAVMDGDAKGVEENTRKLKRRLNRNQAKAVSSGEPMELAWEEKGDTQGIEILRLEDFSERQVYAVEFRQD